MQGNPIGSVDRCGDFGGPGLELYCDFPGSGVNPVVADPGRLYCDLFFKKGVGDQGWFKPEVLLIALFIWQAMSLYFSLYVDGSMAPSLLFLAAALFVITLGVV